MKKILLTIILAGTLVIIFVIFLNIYILRSSSEYISANMADLPESQAALILGARVYSNGNMSDILLDRTIKALELYEGGKVSKILISGDHGQEDYDEVNTVKDYLVDRGVTAEDIFLDHAGFDTYDSLYRSKEVFEVESLIVVTQAFHLPRAVYIGDKLGIETYGYVADRQPYVAAKFNDLRESLARVKAFLNVLFNSKPTYLGDPIPINGDGQLSWD